MEPEREERPSTLHEQLHALLATVAACEAEWALDNRIALALRLRATR